MELGLCLHKGLVVVLLCLMVLSQISIMTHTASADQIIDIEMETSKQIYEVGDAVQITGNVTANGIPVTNATVAVQIVTPNGNDYVIRTVKTGEIPSWYWKVQILDLYTCDSKGIPKTLFNKGAFAYVFMSVKSIDTFLTHHVKAALYIQYSDNTPFKAFYPFEMDIEPGQEVNNTVSLPIPSDAISGETLIFASLLSDTIVNGGTAYCPEETTSFYIATTTPTAKPQPDYFNITFQIPRTGAKLGTYIIYATSHYQNQYPTDIKGFQVILVGDIVKDGRVDMRDVGAICSLYGSELGDPDWNPEADFYKDDTINMRDIGIVCQNFGKSAIY